jgi:hypothetical protein
MPNIIHDHGDEQARKILQNIVSATTINSVLLIDDIVLAESGAPWRATELDIAMLTCLAAKERSENEWRALLESVDLTILEVFRYSEKCNDCLILARPFKFVMESLESLELVF